jgi:cytochrome P450
MTTHSFRPSDDVVLTFNDPEIIPDPYPLYHVLRERSGACLLPLFDGAWVFFRYRNVKDLLNDPRLSNDRTALPSRALPVDQRHKFTEMTKVMERWIGMKDPPVHMPMRRHLNQVMGYLNNEALIKYVQPFADNLVAKITTGETTDLIGQLAYPLPALVIGGLIGAPAEDHRQLAKWCDDLAYVFGSSQLSVEEVEQASKSTVALAEYMQKLARDPKTPRGSLIQRLLHVRTEGFELTEEEAYAQCILLLFAGLEPTRYAIGNAVYALTRHPEQADLLRHDPSLLPNAVEEFLRYDSPVQWVGWTAKESFAFEGHHISKGDLVFPYIAAANRDPEHFENPDALDVRRRNNRHLTFGHGGHHCLGAALVRTQLRLVMGALLKRFSKFRLDHDVPIRWNTNLGFHGHQYLPVQFVA